MTHEVEGRFFGCKLMMNVDRAEFLMSKLKGDEYDTKREMMTRNGRQIEWILMETEKDLMKIPGREFTKMMMDISVPHDLRMFINSRLRGWRV